MSTSQNSSDLVELEPEVFYSTSSCTGVTQIYAKKRIFCKFREDIFNLSDVSEFILD